MLELNSFYNKFAIAMYEGNVEEAKQMFDSQTFSHNFYNFYVETLKIFDKSIFFRACKENKIELVKFLLNSDKISEKYYYYVSKYGEDGCYHGNGFTQACKYGNLEIVKLLIESEKFTNDDKFYNKTIDDMYNGFTIACKKGHSSIVQLLLESNKFSKKFYRYTDEFGLDYHALNYPVKEERLDIIKLLLESDKFSNNKYKLFLAYKSEKIKISCRKSERYDIIQLLENVLQNFPK
jgi:ankyrin repeat protein